MQAAAGAGSAPTIWGLHAGEHTSCNVEWKGFYSIAFMYAECFKHRRFRKSSKDAARFLHHDPVQAILDKAGNCQAFSAPEA